MTHGARTAQEIFNSLRSGLTGKISTLTNFTDNSFNTVWTEAFADEFREKEIELTAAEFAAWIDFSGGPIDQSDLEDLDIEDDMDPEDLEPFVKDDHLEELVKIVGVTRDQGTRATGNVTFTTQSASTSIPEGTEVGTEPDATGDFFSYETTEAVSTSSGETTVQAPVEAVDVGAEYNTGAGTVTNLVNPPGGVQAVTNNEAIDGGEDVESNAELRKRAKNAVFRSSGGGTVQGMIGFIEKNTAASEVRVVEFPTGDSVRNYPHGHVIVVGGTNDNVRDAINASRPAAVEHILRRPAFITLNVTAKVEGQDIDTTSVEEQMTEFADELGLGDDFFQDRLIFTIMGADGDINNISSIEYTVSDQPFFFDSAFNKYSIQLGEEMLDDGITEVTGTLLGSSHTFVEDTDYREIDDDGDGSDDTLDWSIGRSSTTTTISYTSGQTEYQIDNDMIHDGITKVVNTTTSTTLTEGTDYEEADTNGDDLQDGIRFLNAQSGGDSIDITYDFGDLPDVLVNQTFTATFSQEQEKYDIDEALIEDGITKVTGTLNGSSHTFVEGTDFEEWDSDGDTRDEGIDWSIGGDNPDDDTDFTVTYDRGTQFLVDYDIREGDLSIGEDEKISSGNMVVTVV